MPRKIKINRSFNEQFPLFVFIDWSPNILSLLSPMLQSIINLRYCQWHIYETLPNQNAKEMKIANNYYTNVDARWKLSNFPPQIKRNYFEIRNSFILCKKQQFIISCVCVSVLCNIIIILYHSSAPIHKYHCLGLVRRKFIRPRPLVEVHNELFFIGMTTNRVHGLSQFNA